MMKLGGTVVAAAIAFLMAGLLLVAAAADQSSCTSPSVVVNMSNLPKEKVAGYEPEQVKNAAIIAQVAQKRGLSRQGQKVGIMTAMGESSLNNIDYGDDINGVTNPDGSPTCSLGLFQQQWCLGWGTRAQVLDPVYAAGAFFDRLVKITGWEDLAPSIAINRVQGNSDENHYAKFEKPADTVLDAIGAASNGGSCPTGTAPGKDGWGKPANGPVTSRYGLRDGPYPNHTGTDLNGDGCGGPIWAAHAGTVSDVFVDGLGNNVVDVDHGGGIVTRYVHMYSDGILVEKGQKVKGGQQIAKTGASGAAFGCHLHFEILVNNQFVNPETFMEERGVTL